MIGQEVDYYPEAMRDDDVFEKLPIQGKITEVRTDAVKVNEIWIGNEFWRPTRYKYWWNFHGRSETLYYLSYCGIFLVFLWWG